MWEFPWITSESLALLRVEEELLKRGQGDLKVSFPVPINWIEELDIFSNFRLQDPFGLDAAGIGEQGRYYYVESLTYDWMNQAIDVSGVDLQYILRQCMIVGRCSEMPDGGWDDATEWQRMFAFVGSCATGCFPDGELLKSVCKCYY